MAQHQFSELPTEVRNAIEFYLRNGATQVQVLSAGKELQMLAKGRYVTYDNKDVLDITVDGNPYPTTRSRATIDELPSDAQAKFDIPVVGRNCIEYRLGGERIVTVYQDRSGIYQTSDTCVLIMPVK